MNDVISYSIPTKKFILVYNSITCVCMALLVIALIYLEYIYQIGKYNMYMLPLGLVISELFKYVIKTLHQSEVKMVKTRKFVKRIKFREFFTSCAIVSVMIFVYYAISVLFGAPLLSDNEETLMFSVLLTTLTVVPACLHLGPHVTLEILSNLTTYKGSEFCIMMLRTIQITLIGAWLGAIVIPLDWDRPWQIWPIPCSSGALIGYTIANLLNLIIEIK